MNNNENTTDVVGFLKRYGYSRDFALGVIAGRRDIIMNVCEKIITGEKKPGLEEAAQAEIKNLETMIAGIDQFAGDDAMRGGRSVSDFCKGIADEVGRLTLASEKDKVNGQRQDEAGVKQADIGFEEGGIGR